jgi:hypothetical protein
MSTPSVPRMFVETEDDLFCGLADAPFVAVVYIVQ